MRPGLIFRVLVLTADFLFSGIVNVLMTTPLWVVNTRLKLQGAMFRTKGLENNKTKKYKGIIGECIITETRNKEA